MAAPYPLMVRHNAAGMTAKITMQPQGAMDQWWNGSTFVTYVLADLDTYGIATTPIVVGSRFLVANIPTSLANVYEFNAWDTTATSGTLTESSVWIGKKTIKWSGSSVIPADDVFVYEFDYSPLDTVLEPEPITIFRGQDTPVRFVADPATIIDQDFFKARLGTSALDYVEFSVALGNMTVDEASGVILCRPTSAETYALPANSTSRFVFFDLFRTGSGPGNATIVKRLVVNVENTLWTP